MNIHELEALANQIVEEDNDAKAKLLRMIRAYARILAIRQPGLFPRMPTLYADEDGHWDNSYPPEQEYKERTGPRLYTVIDNDRSSRATSGGFYHSTEYFTEDFGLFIARDGALYGCNEHGTGRFGQFAAHPGECNVEVTCEYDALDVDEIPLDRLVKAERELRHLAFPSAAKREEALAGK